MQSHPDFGEVVVVVFGDEVEMVNEAKRLLQARMEQRATKD